MRKLGKILVLVLLTAFVSTISGCGEQVDDASQAKPVVRGLKTVLVKEEERRTLRKYPSVLQPSSISTLSFEIAGRLGKISLDVGRTVKKGEVLARLDTATLKIQIDSAQAALQKARSAVRTAANADLNRKTELLQKGVTTRAVLDQSRNSAESAKAQEIQAVKQLQTSREALKKAILKAPFDGIINSVDVESFANVAPGAPVVTIYSTDQFEARFSVNYDIVNRLTVGKEALIRLSDNPAIVLNGQISELGARADTVSSFPVVISLTSTAQGLKAGMAIEITLEFALANGKGYLLPLTVLALEGRVNMGKAQRGKAIVYVFDEGESVVRRREVTINGIRENALIIVEGLKPGERVASAGVSFLREGQKVKLLANDLASENGGG